MIEFGVPIIAGQILETGKNEVPNEKRMQRTAAVPYATAIRMVCPRSQHEASLIHRDEAEGLALVEHRECELTAVVGAAVEAHPPGLDQVEGIAPVERRVDELALAEPGCPQTAVESARAASVRPSKSSLEEKLSVVWLTPLIRRRPEWFELGPDYVITMRRRRGRSSAVRADDS